MRTATDEKLRLLSWLFPRLEQDEIVAVELPYRDVSRKADLAVLSPKRLAAIEIKGPRDKVGTLVAQVNDYLEGFLEVDIAVATKYLDAVRSIVPRSVGLIELGEDFVERRRRPLAKTQLTAAGALHWLRAKDLQRIIPNPEARTWDIITLRGNAIQTVRHADLSKAAIEAAWSRSRERYAAFLAEKSDVLTLDDVAVLQAPTRVR